MGESAPDGSNMARLTTRSPLPAVTGCAFGAGDLIQTRRNDNDLGVANRQQWIVQHVENDGTVYARRPEADGQNPHTVALPAEYVGEYAHLSLCRDCLRGPRHHRQRFPHHAQRVRSAAKGSMSA